MVAMGILQRFLWGVPTRLLHGSYAPYNMCAMSLHRCVVGPPPPRAMYSNGHPYGTMFESEDGFARSETKVHSLCTCVCTPSPP